LDGTFDVADGPQGLEKALNTLCHQAEEASRDGYQLIVISDRNAGTERVPVSSLLALGTNYMLLSCASSLALFEF
jgi:hypothetical protein